MVSNVDNDNYKFSGIQSPVNCNTLKIITLYCLISMIVSVSLNSLLIVTLITWHRHLRKPFNLLLLALSSINLIGSLSEFPVVIISSYECKWLFKKLGCQITGFLMYFTGCTGLFLVTFMSYERYYTLSEPYRLKIMQTKMVVLIILFCVGFSLFWTITPLIGWSHYSLEGALISCSVEWAERTFNVLSYNITMFIFVFVAPYLTILLSNGYLIRVIRNVSNRRLNNNAMQNNRHTVRKRLRVEKNITVSVIFIIVAFSITWFPYAIVSLYAAFSSNPIHPLITTLPSMFAKSSMYWSPAMFIVSNKNVRRIIKRNFLICFRINR